MSKLAGVFTSQKVSGEKYYRASITYQLKHISLGSYATAVEANKAYKKASLILTSSEGEQFKIEDYRRLGEPFLFDKWVMLINLKENGMYCRNPILLKHKYFIYYLDPDTPLKFDVDDLFYYMKHKIMRRGGHLFVSEYGMQINLLSRYGIKNYAVPNRDYRFANGDSTDYRYRNIQIINRYHGVTKDTVRGAVVYTAKIHIVGDIIVGRYLSETEAAIAYNKAAAILKSKGLKKDFPENYVDEYNEIQYAKIYHSLRINRRIRDFKCCEI